MCGSRASWLLAVAAGFQSALAPAYGTQAGAAAHVAAAPQFWVTVPSAPTPQASARQESSSAVWALPALVVVAVGAARLGMKNQVATAAVAGVARRSVRGAVADALLQAPLRPAAAPRSAGVAMKLDMPGSGPPLGFFDPLGFSKNASPETMKKYREAELKHGRVAMLAAAGMITADMWHPLFGGKNSSNPLLALTQTPKLGWLQILTFIMFIEVLGILNSRRPDYQPGDFLGSSQWELDDTWKSYQTKELNNGRLAMFGSIGMLVGSYITGKGPLEVMGGGDTIVF